MKKTILFIGSNPLKTSHFMPAKESGHRMILLKDKINPKDKIYFDDTIVSNLFDANKTLEKVRKYHSNSPIHACLTRFEPWVPLVGLICRRLNLPGPSIVSSLNARDKLMMRLALASKGIPQPKFVKVTSLYDVKKAAKYLGYPFLLKPLSGAKSRYIKKILKPSEIEPAYNIVSYRCQHSPGNLFTNFIGIDCNDFHNTLIAEEFLIGKQVTTTSLVAKKKIHHIDLADLVTAQDKGLDAFYLISRTTPSLLKDSMKKRICNVSSEAIKALGLNNTPLHPEMILTKDGPKIIEIAARIGGYRTEMTEFAMGIKLNEIAIKIALGEDFSLNKNKELASTAVEVWPTKSGKIKKYSNVEKIKKRKDVKIFTIKKKIDSMYHVPPIGEKPVAYFFTVGKTPKKSLDSANEIINDFKIELE